MDELIQSNTKKGKAIFFASITILTLLLVTITVIRGSMMEEPNTQDIIFLIITHLVLHLGSIVGICTLLGYFGYSPFQQSVIENNKVYTINSGAKLFRGMSTSVSTGGSTSRLVRRLGSL
jgi:hypothetical protein